MYWRPPSAAKLSAFGLTAEDLAPDAAEVWPENWPAVKLFGRCGGQWKTGMSGPTGLDYTLPLKLMDRMGLDDKQYDALLDSLNILETEALSTMNEADE